MSQTSRTATPRYVLVDGRRGLLLAQDVEAVVDESGELMVAEQARVLALDAPHVERLVQTAAGRSSPPPGPRPATCSSRCSRQASSRTRCSRFARGG